MLSAPDTPHAEWVRLAAFLTHGGAQVFSRSLWTPSSSPRDNAVPWFLSNATGAVLRTHLETGRPPWCSLPVRRPGASTTAASLNRALARQVPLLVAADALRLAHARNLDRWASATAAVGGAGTVWATGLGKSALVARKFAASATSFGRSAHFLHPVEALHGDAGSVRGGDVLLAVSASGRTAEVLRVVRELAVPVVSVCPAESPLAGLSTAVLDASVDVEAGGEAPSTSFLVAMALVEGLVLSMRPAGGLHHPGGFIGLSRRPVRELMLPPPLVERDRSLLSCIPLLGCGAVLVVGGGIFTDGDLRRLVGRDAGALEKRVGDVCTSSPVSVRDDESCALALDRMERRGSQLSVLPVVDAAGHYVGLVRLHDLVRAGLGA